MKIVVLAGGYSPEREVSLNSGSLIANALMEAGHRILLLDVYKGYDGDISNPEALFCTGKHYEHKISDEVPDLEALKAASGNGDALIGKNVLELCRYADRVFLALHGAMGENGQLQATLDSFGIRYTGSGYIGSLLAMDKDLSKRLLREAGIPVPEGITIRAHELCGGLSFASGRIEREVGFPCVIKPCACGSSVGVSMVDREEELPDALTKAKPYGDLLAEKRIYGRELTVSVLDGKALPVVEIIPDEGFYDYKNKYQGTTREVCPAELPEKTEQLLSELSLRAFGALHLHGYARFDFLLDEGGNPYCLEANTLPGMTPTSLLPQAARAVGISYTELCEKILSL